MPDDFPEGCEFFDSSGGDDRVVFPDGSTFGLSSDGASLVPKGLPLASSLLPSTEAAFRRSAAAWRDAAAAQVVLGASVSTAGKVPVPASFPEGCEFVANFSGDDFVRFPDGKVFKLNDDGATLDPWPALPRSGAPSSEGGFLSAAATCRKFRETGSAVAALAASKTGS